MPCPDQCSQEAGKLNACYIKQQKHTHCVTNVCWKEIKRQPGFFPFFVCPCPHSPPPARLAVWGRFHIALALPPVPRPAGTEASPPCHRRWPSGSWCGDRLRQAGQGPLCSDRSWGGGVGKGLEVDLLGSGAATRVAASCHFQLP